jgi:hypothetical protein
MIVYVVPNAAVLGSHVVPAVPSVNADIVGVASSVELATQETQIDEQTS